MTEPVVQFAFEAPAAGRPSLARIQVVEGLVGQFAREVMNIRHDFRVGAPGGRDALARYEALAKRYGDIFLGRSDAYEPAPWSSRTGAIMRYLADTNELATRRNDPGTAFFISVAKVVVACCIQLEEKKRPDDAIGADLQAYLLSVADRLIGATQ